MNILFLVKDVGSISNLGTSLFTANLWGTCHQCCVSDCCNIDHCIESKLASQKVEKASRRELRNFEGASLQL